MIHNLNKLAPRDALASENMPISFREWHDFTPAHRQSILDQIAFEELGLEELSDICPDLQVADLTSIPNVTSVQVMWRSRNRRRAPSEISVEAIGTTIRNEIGSLRERMDTLTLHSSAVPYDRREGI
jgi:hypothetical protein